LPKDNNPQLEDIRLLLLNFSVYGGVGLLSKLVSFISIPLLTFHLNIGEYGALEFFYTLSYLLVVILIFGQDAALARYFYESKSIDDQQSLVTSSLSLQLLLAALVVTGFWLIAEKISYFLINVADRLIFFQLVLLQVPFLLIIDFCAGLLKWAMARTAFVVLTVGFSFFQLFTLVAIIIIFELNIYSALVANFFASLLFAIVGLFLIRNWLCWPKNFLHLKKLLPFALPLGIVSIIISIQPIVERALIDKYIGLEALGVYALASKILLIVALVFSAFQSAWGPFSMTSLNKNYATETRDLVAKLFCSLGCVFVLLIGLFSDPLIRILGNDQYLDGTTIVIILALGQLIQHLFWIFELGIRISKKTYLTTLSFITGFLVMVTLVSLLATRYGLLGLALGVLAGKFTTLIVSLIFAYKITQLRYDYRSIFLLLGATTILVLVVVAAGLRYGHEISSLILLIGICLLLSLSWTKLFSAKERSVILKALAPRGG